MAPPFLEECLEILTRTPAVLDAQLRGLAEVWIDATEGPGTWSPYVVVGHLIHGEETDWIPRLEIILRDGASRTFDPFDREAQLRQARRPLGDLLDEFAALRRRSLDRLREMNLQPADLERQGRHPGLGLVTARQLLATWTAHDLGHLVQVNRVMARRFRTEVGPWAQHLSVMSGQG